MYVCGPTVYDKPHIGHARSAYVFDVIRRYLKYRGYEVEFVRNVTDVDDKIIDKAVKEFPGLPLIEAVNRVSGKYLESYNQAMADMGIGAPDSEPKATEYIDKMKSFIENLISRGAAYAADGDVYFDITKARDYGKLSGQDLSKMNVGLRIALGEKKKNPLDFALWKSAKEGEPSWDSPWGKGRPGWHIECSVMSSDILGDEFDIHGGGIDLIFPHHENEIVQSEGLGKKFARVWIHHGLLTINGQKMAKSLGNFITVQDFIAGNDDGFADYLKLLFLNTHYRHPVDYTDEKVVEMKKERERFNALFRKLRETYGGRRDLSGLPVGDSKTVDDFKKKFENAMDDDFNTPRALAVLFDLATYLNKFIHQKSVWTDAEIWYIKEAQRLLEELSEDVFGLGLRDEFRYAKGLSFEEIELKITERARLKKEKKYVEADGVRKSLEEKGIILEDNKDGKTIWRRKI